MPFLFAYASDLAQIPDDFKATIAGWEDAEIVKFAPQWQVLDHDATGYFLVSQFPYAWSERADDFMS